MACPYCHGTGTITTTVPAVSEEALFGMVCPWCWREDKIARGHQPTFSEWTTGVLLDSARRVAKDTGREVDEESFEVWRRYLDESVRMVAGTGQKRRGVRQLSELNAQNRPTYGGGRESSTRRPRARDAQE